MSNPTSSSLRSKFLREVGARGAPAGAPRATGLVGASELDPLPEPAQRYLKSMGVLGKPRDTTFRAHFTGHFRLKPGPFMPCEAWQYNSSLDVSRMFHMRALYGGFIPLHARDTYVDGHGRMLGKLADLVTIVDGRGPELDTGELVTYLNDAVLLAPSFLLGPETRWSAVDDSSFDLTFSHGGRSVGARVRVAPDGSPVDFSTTDRYHQTDFKSPLQKTRWSTPVEATCQVEGRRVVCRARAVWHLAEGPFCYAEFTLDAAALAFNVPPGE